MVGGNTEGLMGFARRHKVSMRAGSHPLRGNSGFSLIEALIIMTVIGIVVGIAMPHVDIKRFRMNEAVREVSSTLARAQYRAVLHQHDVIVWFDVTPRRLRVHEDRNNDGVVQANEPVTAVELPEGVVFGRGPAPARPMGLGPVTFRQRFGTPYVTFHRNGSASEAGGLYLTATGTPVARDARAVEVERSTGRASWFFHDGNAWQRGF